MQVLQQGVPEQVVSSVSRTMAGIVSSPARWTARQRRSPITSSNRPSASGRTTTGCSSPTSWIDSTSSSIASSSNTVRGCRGLGEMSETGKSAKYDPGGTAATASGGGLRGRNVRWQRVGPQEQFAQAPAQPAAFGGRRHAVSLAPRRAIS